MSESTILLGGAVVVGMILSSLVIVVLRLWRRVIQLEQRFAPFDARMQRGSNDVIGLCSAAIMVDRRLAINEARLQNLQESIVALQMPQTPMNQAVEPDDLALDFEDDASSAQGYDKVIRMIRQGADVDMLVKNCGVTRDEAMLLLRLHGQR